MMFGSVYRLLMFIVCIFNQNVHAYAYITMTQIFLIHTFHTLSIIGYGAGGAGVLPGAGMPTYTILAICIIVDTCLKHTLNAVCPFLGIRYPTGAGVGQGGKPGKGSINRHTKCSSL